MAVRHFEHPAGFLFYSWPDMIIFVVSNGHGESPLAPEITDLLLFAGVILPLFQTKVKPLFPENYHRWCGEGGGETKVEQALDYHSPVIGPEPSRWRSINIQVKGSVKRVEDLHVGGG